MTRTLPSRRALAVLLATALAPLIAMAAYPDHAIRMVVPYPPGGATDVIGRILATRLSAALSQQVVVENKGGASGNLGADAVAKAAPGGYTLLMAAMTSHATMATLGKGRIPYDLLKDLQPVQVVGYVPLVFVVHPSVPVSSFAQLVTHARANPGKLSYASSGAAAPQRMAAELFRRQTGADMLHVPYKGSGPAMTDLVGGQVNLMAETVPAALPFIRSGKLRALAVTTPERIPMLPDVPTVAEAGGAVWNGFEVVSTFGVMVPAGTPAAVVQLLSAELGRIMQNAEAKEQMLQQGVYALPPLAPDKAAERLRTEVTRWARVINETGVKSDE